MVASPSGISFFGTRLMVGFGGLTTDPSYLLSVLKEFGLRDYHLHLSIAHSLLGDHS